MTNERVHLGLITASVPLHPEPPAFPFRNWGVQGGDLGGEAPAIDGVGGPQSLPCLVEVAEIPADWKYVGGL